MRRKPTIQVGTPPLVSVLLPVRNGAAWVKAACTDVLANSEPLELVVIDDASTDSGPALLAGLAARDARVRLCLLDEHRGIAGALNAGLELARGPLIARMDADDRSSPGRLDAQVRAWRQGGEREDAVIACLVAVQGVAGAAGPGLCAYVAWQNSLLSPAEHWAQRLIEAPVCHGTVLLARSLIERAGGWRSGPFPEDYDLWLRLFEIGANFSKVPRCLYRWRDHPQRATRTDPRYGPAAFRALKLSHLQRTWLGPRQVEELQILGAGQDARGWCDGLKGLGVRVARVFDVNPRRVGASLRGEVPVVAHDRLAEYRHVPALVAIGRAVGRQRARCELLDLGLSEGSDFLCVQ